MEWIEIEAIKRLKQNGERIRKIQHVKVCRNIICISVKKALPEICKMTTDEFVRQVQKLDGDSVTVVSEKFPNQRRRSERGKP